ncbi:protein kinase [Streptomyces bambusae]|uniref:WD40 repeat domain-containing serine/threonine-protein kinase n=1 Tax=Streptomyces bambusae TaxID=1550616 RepID=UPI001CFF39ED|nr:WD40 repeat domain-containing serine/threonine-protein kinase [Streptomyces bambusae]MCB5167267.1 protein kinase [Streptomyces bambusae]
MGSMLHPDDPERLGGYWLAARLGAGGQGVVYEAYDATGGRVAVKALHRDAEQFVRSRFAKEVDAARAVAPFCTARILDADVSDDAPYIVSEYIPGPTLGAAVRDHGTFDPEAVTRLAAGVATALAAIHQAKVVHRDLKPGNVLLGPDGPRVIDFGIARAADMSLTATGAIMGTLGYMAPEVLGGQRATTASDVFAWGALVLYAASGEEPFRGDSIGQVAHRTAAVDPDLSALPAPLRPLVAAALAKEPDLRPSAAELLLGLVGETPASADPRRALLEAGARRAADPRPEADVPGLGERAEAAYARLSLPAQQAAHELLLRLVVPGEDPDGSQDTVRTASYAEVYDGRSDAERREGHAAITALAAAGALIVAEDHSIRPVSAALIRAWTRLRAWTEADRVALGLRNRLGHAAREWERHGRRPEDLVQGTALRAALDWSAGAAPHIRPNPLEVAFLAAGRVSATRTARRRRQLLGGLGVLLVVALLAGGLAYQQSQAAAREQSRAAARTTAQAATSLRAADPKLAMLLGVASWRIAETEDSRAALLGAVNQAEADMLRVRSASGIRQDSYRRLSDDGRVFVLGEAGEFQVWDVPGRRMLASSRGKAGLADATIDSISPDGRLLLASDRDGAQVLDARTLKPVGPRLGGLDGLATYKAQITTNGLVVADHRILRASDGRQLAAHAEGEDIAVSPDGRLAATCPYGGPVRLWRLGTDGLTGTPLATPRGTRQPECGADGRLQFSADGKRLAALSRTGQQFLWRAADGTHLGSVAVTELADPALSSEGRFVLGYNNNTGAIDVYPTDGEWQGPYLTYPARGTGNVNGDEQIVYAIDDKQRRLVFHRTEASTVDTVDVAGPPVGLPSELSGETRTGTVSRNGRVAMAQALGHEQQLVDLRTGRALGPRVPQREDKPGASEFRASLSADGSRLAFADEHDVVVWDVAAGKELFRKEPQGYWIQPLTLSPDGRYVAAFMLAHGSEGNATFLDRPGTIQVWDVASGKPLHRIESLRKEGPTIAISPDSTLLVSAAGDALDLTTGKHRRNVFKDESVGALAFSPDGKTLAVFKENGLTALWDGKVTEQYGALPGAALGPGGDHYGEGVGHFAFSPDGRLLAGRVGDDAVQLWDLKSRLALGAPLNLEGKVHDIAFDGAVLRTPDRQNPLRSLDTDPDVLIESVCRRVGGRDVTEGEWGQYVPRGIPYRKVCS